MSDTPKTDAKAHEAMRQFSGHPTGVTEAFEAVDSCFARDLERRLARANALLAEMKQAVKWAKDEAKERLQRLDSAACERRQWMESEHRAKKAERESFARWCQAIGRLSTIAEDCEAWLHNQCDETACEFIKSVRDYARKAVQE
jgi:hypothetical protein